MCWRDVICVTTESSNILTKKKIFDAYMSKVRLQEEKVILMREMRQHCTYLRRLAGNIRRMMSDMSSGRDSGKKLIPGTILLILVTPWPNSTEILACLSFTFPSRQHKWRGESSLCLLQKRLADVEDKFHVARRSYSQALGPNAASLLEDLQEEIPEEHKDYESSDDSDFEAV